jgi:hypothetical protein
MVDRCRCLRAFTIHDREDSALTGSPMPIITMGIVEVARWAARAAVEPATAMTFTGNVPPPDFSAPTLDLLIPWLEGRA